MLQPATMMHDLTRAPALTTERLLLRLPEERDLDAMTEAMADGEAMRFVNRGLPVDRSECWRRMAAQLGHWSLRGFGPFAVELRATGAWIGKVGLWRPEGWPGLELIWTIAPAHWGRGYATEAARAVRDWAVPTHRLERLISLIDPDNVGSRRVAERLGCRRGDAMPFLTGTVEVWHHPLDRRDGTALPRSSP